MRVFPGRRLAIAAVLGPTLLVAGSCFFSLPDVLTPGPDGGGGSGGGGATWTGTVLVDCTWDASAPPCWCYNNDQINFYCGHAVIGAAAAFYHCIPPAVAFSNPNDLLTCIDGGWSVGLRCHPTCKQTITPPDASDYCLPNPAPPALCPCYKQAGDALYCAHAVAGYADDKGCVPPLLVAEDQGALLRCTANGVWSVAVTCPQGCGGDYHTTDASDPCCQ
jgi:hypothetical protein